jgi:hypothetical protein
MLIVQFLLIVKNWVDLMPLLKLKVQQPELTVLFSPQLQGPHHTMCLNKMLEAVHHSYSSIMGSPKLRAIHLRFLRNAIRWNNPSRLPWATIFSSDQKCVDEGVRAR